MKIGIITDIHNNIEALKAVRREFEKVEVDGIICCGDILGIGPRPEETVKEIMSLTNLIACVQGNHEHYLLEGMPDSVPNEQRMGYAEMEHHRWEHSQLSDEAIKYLSKLPSQVTVKLGGLNIYVAHYAMDAEDKYVQYRPNPNLSDLENMFMNIKADIILYGHDHQLAVNRDDKSWYINCGPLGCLINNLKYARAGILTMEEGQVDFESLLIQYDTEKVIKDILELDYPDSNNILKYFYGL
ncbi:MAG: metallophosphoesterase family protein [Cellulosilyticaceae bacterium]